MVLPVHDRVQRMLAASEMSIGAVPELLTDTVTGIRF